MLQVFWIGPLVGGSVAAILYEYLFSAGATFTRTKKCLTRSKVPPSSPEKPLVAAPEDAEVIEIEEKKDLDQEQDDPEKTNQTDGQQNRFTCRRLHFYSHYVYGNLLVGRLYFYSHYVYGNVVMQMP